VETIKEVPRCIFTLSHPGSAIHCQEDSLSYAEVIAALRDAGLNAEQQLRSWMIGCGILCPRRLIQRLGNCEYGASAGFADDQHNALWSYETPEQQMRHLSELRSLQQTALNREYPAGITVHFATICRSKAPNLCAAVWDGQLWQMRCY